MVASNGCLPNLCVFSNCQEWSHPQRQTTVQCHECGRQFLEDATKKVIDGATRELIERLMLASISLAGIARAAEVSEQWLQTYVNQKSACVPGSVQVMPKQRGD